MARGRKITRQERAYRRERAAREQAKLVCGGHRPGFFCSRAGCPNEHLPGVHAWGRIA